MQRNNYHVKHKKSRQNGRRQFLRHKNREVRNMLKAVV